VNLVNVYLPPATSLARRGVDEDKARSQLEEFLASIPYQHRTIICGDFNTRIGSLAP
jgi:Endonuclease/Exonuclease/phosphatase family.